MRNLERKKIGSICLLFGKTILLFLLNSACQQKTQEVNISENKHQTTNVSKNIGKDCVTNYHPDTDYFPDRIDSDYATGFTVEYRNHYKVVTVKNPWKDADVQFQYVLVQCGTPIPKGYKKAQIITVPVQTVVTMSTTHLPHLQKLRLLEKLVGVSSFKNINTSEVRKKIERRELKEVGNNASVNVEQLLELNPDLIMTYGSGNPEFDSHPKLLEAGLPVVINAEYLESSPLGRTEWIKFTATFFNREAKAEEVFSAIATEYERIASLARKVENKPTVFTGFSFKGTWYVAGGKSYFAQYLADAGANYLWSDNNSKASLPLDFESVFQRGAEADFWLNGSQSWSSLNDILMSDDRYKNFAALQTGQVFNNNAILNETGGNDYWESGIANPHIVLSDLITIFHPQLLPDRELVYYRQLN